MATCTWAIQTFLNDTSTDWGVVDQVLLRSQDPFAISHATNTILIYFMAISLAGNVYWWMVYMYNKLERSGIESNNQFLISVGGWSKDLIHKHLQILAVLKILIWEMFEVFISWVSTTLVYYVPTISTSSWLICRIIAQNWFRDAPLNTFMDFVDGLIAIGFGIYILWKTSMIFWKPRPWLNWWIRVALVFMTAFTQCLPMVYIQLNTCLPPIPSTSVLFSGGYTFNFLWIGLYGYMVLTVFVYICFWLEDMYLYPKECMKITESYFWMLFYVVWVCFCCVIPIWGYYVHLTIGRASFAVILWFNHKNFGRRDFWIMELENDSDGDNDIQTIVELDGYNLVKKV